VDVILADDERIIREGVAESLDWDSIGCRLVGTADTGFDALALIREKQPQCVVTDIRMPLMNGLELIRTVQEERADCRFIILSGYDEFEFARQAMKYGVRYYLLKPFDEEELADVLVKIRQEIEADDIAAFTPEMQTGNREIDKILVFLNVHYRRRELSLKWVADNLVFKNKDYLGKLFKNCTGKTFNQYLANLRIRRATDFLRKRPDTSIIELAEVVGYPANGDYFCVQFKKNTGMTVTQFRASLCGSSKSL
jgi:YesN/AraC family two-component response regulator